MSYISILVPAFYLKNETDKEEIKKFCSEQFETDKDSFDLIDIVDDSISLSNNIYNYALKFKESDLSINSIEDLIYQRDCIKSIYEKTFESLKAMTAKFNDVEKEIKNFYECGNNNEEVKKDLVNDNMKLRDLLSLQIEASDNFRINTEKTLNKIKEEFQNMVQELETMRKKTAKSKPATQRDVGTNLSTSVKKKVNINTNVSNNSGQTGVSVNNGIYMNGGNANNSGNNINVVGIPGINIGSCSNNCVPKLNLNK